MYNLIVSTVYIDIRQPISGHVIYTNKTQHVDFVVLQDSQHYIRIYFSNRTFSPEESEISEKITILLKAFN
jgi:hypothetical protein